MRSWKSRVIRVNVKENEILLEQVRKYLKKFVQETSGTNYARDTQELKMLSRLLRKLENNDFLFKKS